MEGINSSSSSSSSRIDLDRLPIKRLDAIDEFGNEQFPPDVGREEKRLSMLRRIDFSFVVDRDSKKQKKEKEKEKEKAPSSSKDSAAAPQQTWPWQGLVENLQLAHQELSVIMDLIGTVEANDFVAVAGMQRPKQLPNEVIADLAVSAATKFQRLRQVGRYFKQSAKAMEQKISKESRFYSSLIRLQQNWKVKRLRMISTAPNKEGFTFDLQDNLFSDLIVFSHSSSPRTVQVTHDAAGYLAIQKPQKSGHSISVTFLGIDHRHKQRKFSKRNVSHFDENTEAKKNEVLTEADKCVKDTHSILREIHHLIFVEQIFDMVIREVYNPSPGISVTGMREDLLKLAVGQDTSICVSLVPSEKEYAQTMDSCEHSPNEDDSILHSHSLASTMTTEKNNPPSINSLHIADPVSLEVYLLHIFHENALIRLKDRYNFSTRAETPTQPSDDSGGLLGHFCKTLAHRVFSIKVLSELERLVSRVPYINFLSHPTLHSRTSSWSLSLKVPQSVIHASGQFVFPENHASQFHTKVVVKDDQISVSSEGAPTIGGSFRGTPAGARSVNCYGCDLEDFSTILLQQIAGQVIGWLHEEALVVGMKANRDFLCLHFDLDQGDTLDLVAHVDPNDVDGCISWWMILDDGLMEEKMYSTDNSEHGNHQYLGHLSLESLYSMLLDVVSLCSSSRSR